MHRYSCRRALLTDYDTNHMIVVDQIPRLPEPGEPELGTITFCDWSSSAAKIRANVFLLGIIGLVAMGLLPPGPRILFDLVDLRDLRKKDENADYYPKEDPNVTPKKTEEAFRIHIR
ncbi:hypothetical protein DACRYDRAFT_23041 [Dacryopinax primogenitus]|uniref:Uncharacterized protein n=1 Tax=Dacryopinax primogenitus (strain DJM 731) TaxID=1858805 RepID=M5FXX6_DACPD|nr:uncharacterized protein DACRYDRAFT_23041 [Dacryopinax primogenitus]EJU00635.1 hypothetical protein DACRYDRAFT_23041 [Dacryopinax primogenitus]